MRAHLEHVAEVCDVAALLLHEGVLGLGAAQLRLQPHHRRDGVRQLPRSPLQLLLHVRVRRLQKPRRNVKTKELKCLRLVSIYLAVKDVQEQPNFSR